MWKWIACGLCIWLILGCGELPPSFPKDEENEQKPLAFMMMVDGEEVVWAYAAESGPLNGPVMAEGLLLENLTPDKALDAATAKLSLLRAVNGRVNRGSEAITFLDKHPDNSQLSLSYQLRLEQPVTVKKLSGSRFKVYINLYKAPPSYTNAQGVHSPRIPIGTVSMPEGRSRAYVLREPTFQLASISQGAKVGSWGLMSFSQTNRPSSGSSTPASNWCETATAHAGTLQNQSWSHTSLACRPRPSEFDLCAEARQGIDGCIGPAPVETSSPFSDVGSLDTTYLNDYDQSQRVYTMNPQAPNQAKVTAVFVAKEIAATETNNSQKCKDLFRASGWTVGARVNAHCILTPAPSPKPVNGRLACGVTLQFVNDRTYQDKNCYVSGIFNGEEEFMEQFLIYRE